MTKASPDEAGMLCILSQLDGSNGILRVHLNRYDFFPVMTSYRSYLSDWWRGSLGFVGLSLTLLPVLRFWYFDLD